MIPKCWSHVFAIMKSRWYLVAIPLMMLFIAIGNSYLNSGGWRHISPPLLLNDLNKIHPEEKQKRNNLPRRFNRKFTYTCSVEYFKKRSRQNSLRNIAEQFSHFTNHSGEGYQTHLEAETLTSNSTLISYVNQNITKEFNSTYLNPCWFETTAGKQTCRQLKCLPYFFLAGFPKCGTTDLYSKMTHHPQIIPGNKKEPHWWTRRRLPDKEYINFTTGEVSDGKTEKVTKYQSFYDRAANCMEQIGKLNLPGQVRLITGDGSASTFWDNRYWTLLPGNAGLDEPRVIMADHIRHYLPESKIIIIVREPSSRLWSDYLYFWKNDSAPSAEDFHKKTMDAIRILTDCIKWRPLRACAYDRGLDLKIRIKLGLYSVYLRDWYNVFPRQQIHVLRTEDYAKSPAGELAKIFEFLRLDPVDELDSILKDLRRQNSRRSNLTMWPKTEQLLRKFYAPFNADLANLLDNNNYLWEQGA